MHERSDIKFAIKTHNGTTVMLLDNMEHVERWLKKTIGLYGPMAPAYTLHRQTIQEIQIEMPNV